jgi:hypothetical protein
MDIYTYMRHGALLFTAFYRTLRSSDEHSCFILGKSPISKLCLETGYPDYVFYGFLQFLQINARIVP